ncbi:MULTISPECIES: DUF2958 domain-containing protein [unclassified Bradyrhizobium]|uniref:DUF2958 domain-containing protein n=1 Tax=unclassified Bradyrhizobium TaxID=2631580 RepID=UPI00070D4D1B|nr:MULTISPECIES: DUF2958 domain-containing protein [unclassified Bradyrhizobium]KQT27369.1 single-stranded DNA endonuclease [Bradyrhizobium sp. Leaf396]
MILLTTELREQLLANGRDRDANHIPVAKFFNPLGEGVWLATELDEDGDTLFGLADLGEPELGSFSLAEITAVRLPLGLGIERDLLFEGLFPISVWAEAGRRTGSIREVERVLHAAHRSAISGRSEPA